jgi:two-component system NarL family response regulator
VRDEPPISGCDQSIRVFLVERAKFSLLDLRELLEPFSDFRIVGHAIDSSRAASALRAVSAGVVIVDFDWPSGGGLEAIRQIRSELPELPIMALSASKEGPDARACFQAGASGYCLKGSPPGRLVLAIRSISQGAGWIDPELSGTVLRPSLAQLISLESRSSGKSSREIPLSDRELQVLQLIAEGMSNQEIAQQLIVSPETVKTHIKHIMEKLAVSDRTQAVVTALRRGLVT